MLSLNYPVQSHATHFDLKTLVQEDGFKKSIRLQARDLSERGPTGFGTPAGTANTIVNNHFDLLAFRAFTLGPAAAKDAVEDNLFENVGHAFHVTYDLTLGVIAATIDRNFAVIPNPIEWREGLQDLSERKIEGYYHGSPVGLWPIGAYEIFEGQARFSQIQYLSYACGHRLDFNDFKKFGLLSGKYVEAFEHFLRLTDSQWPQRANDPLVGLFLLICDLAINPGCGFPFPIAASYETFIRDTNPADRFVLFSRLIALKFPAFKKAVVKCDRTEYATLVTELSLAARDYSILQIAQTFSGWFTRTGPLADLLREYETYKFEAGNFVIRHLLAHFLAFQKDKYRSPEFFCWPGAWMAGDRTSDSVRLLFEQHGALFVDKEEDDGVFARLQPNRNEAAVQRTFNQFYHNAVVFDLTNQWIGQAGSFNYDIEWLDSKHSHVEAKAFLRRQFISAFDLDPEDVQRLR
jgi:hypothetical protein